MGRRLRSIVSGARSWDHRKRLSLVQEQGIAHLRTQHLLWEREHEAANGTGGGESTTRPQAPQNKLNGTCFKCETVGHISCVCPALSGGGGGVSGRGPLQAMMADASSSHVEQRAATVKSGSSGLRNRAQRNISHRTRRSCMTLSPLARDNSCSGKQQPRGGKGIRKVLVKQPGGTVKSTPLQRVSLR